MSSKVLLDSLGGEWQSGTPPPAGIILENMRRRGFDFMRLWLYGGRHSLRSLFGCLLATAMAAVAGFILDGWMLAIGLGALFLLVSVKLDTAKWRMSSVVIVLGDRLAISQARRGKTKGAETIVPFSMIESIEVEKASRLRRRSGAVRIDTEAGGVRVGEGLPAEALAWLRSHLIMEAAGLTWKPVFDVGRRTMRDKATETEDTGPAVHPRITAKLARLYMQEAPDHIAQLAHKVGKRDPIGIKRETHWLKSSSANVGARQLSVLCQMLEIRALNNDLAAVDADHARIAAEFARVKAVLDAVIEAANGGMALPPAPMPRFAVGEQPGGPDERARRFDARVLVVDDSMVNREVVAEYLQSYGCTVEMADNGEQAIYMSTAELFDLVLMDCQMPVIDGYQATRAIRLAEIDLARKPVPIVALTANNSADDMKTCLQAGMNDYVTKPFVEEHILKLLASWVGHKEQLATDDEAAATG